MAAIKLEALCTIVDGKGAHAPGAVVEVESEVEAKALIARGFAKEYIKPKAEKAEKADKADKADKAAAEPEAPADGG